MSKLAAFLDKYDTVIFDMDGVVTSEQCYWTCAALTVWEWLYSKSLYGNEDISARQMCENAQDIRAQVFLQDKLISLLKNKGVNSNWDLGYVVFAVSKILDTDDFSRVMDFCTGFGANILDEYGAIAEKLSEVTGRDCARNGDLWYEMVMTFQEWFLGDELFEKTFSRKSRLTGKPGLIQTEKPLIKQHKLTEIFDCLTQSGKRLAVGTGRPSNELYLPLESFGILDCFAKDGIINHDHVMNAERNLGMNLTKPHPYIFLKAMLGEGCSDEKIIAGDYDKSRLKTILVVGDAGADILAAKAMGADFCAVLTGVSGIGAKGYFEELGAEYILSSIEEFLSE